MNIYIYNIHFLDLFCGIRMHKGPPKHRPPIPNKSMSPNVKQCETQYPIENPSLILDLFMLRSRTWHVQLRHHFRMC